MADRPRIKKESRWTNESSRLRMSHEAFSCKAFSGEMTNRNPLSLFFFFWKLDKSIKRDKTKNCVFSSLKKIGTKVTEKLDLRFLVSIEICPFYFKLVSFPFPWLCTWNCFGFLLWVNINWILKPQQPPPSLSIHFPAQLYASPRVGVRDALVFSSLHSSIPHCVCAEQMPVLGKVLSRGTASSILVYN